MSEHSHLWNDLPLSERERLMPHQIETQIQHLEQCRAMIVRNHERQVREIDDWIKNCRKSLQQATAQQE